MFIDEAEIYVCSGKGGNGVVHFRREKFISHGGPDGGDGGKGGDVILEVISTLNTLAEFRKKSKFIADDGKNGAKSRSTGRSAETLVIHVPPGTLAYDASNNKILGDLIYPGQQILVCKGGRGGRGNVHFTTSRHQAPRIAEKGEPGEARNLRLELKLIADVGIVGVPNAGKSSLLQAVTNATPKIADYPFTTIEPNLGVARLDLETSLVLADIPGLIEGAHHGIGLGDAFLRHIQRTKVLIHVIDGLSKDPIADFTQTNNELALFDPNLGKKVQIVAFNKMDIPEVQVRWPLIKKELEKHNYQVFPISALTRSDLQPLLWKASELLSSAVDTMEITELPVYRPPADKNVFSIERVPGGWRVTGASIERSASMTYWEFEESVRRFQKLMERLGVDEALRKAGIKVGETVFIGDYELEWQE